MAANRIFIQVDFQSQTANQAINTLNQNISGIGKASEQATQQASQGVKGFSASIEQAKSATDQLAQALVGLGIGRTLQQFVMMGDSINAIKRAFEAQPGGMEAWKQLEEVAQRTGVYFGDLMQNANRLRNAGVPIKEIAGLMSLLENQTKKAAASQEDLNAVVEAWARISANGYVTAKMLFDAFNKIGLFPMKAITEKLQISPQEAREDTRRLNPAWIMQQMQLQAAQAGGYAQQDVSKNLSASLNQLKNDAIQTAAELSRVLTPSLREVIAVLEDLLKPVNAAIALFDKLPKWLRDSAVAAVALGVGLGSVVTALSLMKTGIEAVMALDFLKWILGLVAGITELETVLGGIAALGIGGGPIGLAVGAVLAGIWAITQAKKDAKKAEQSATTGTGDVGPALLPDYQKIKEEELQALNILSEAQKRYFEAGKEGIAAVTAEYEVHFRTVVDSAVATANVRKALELSIATEVKKDAEEMHKQNIKSAQEDAALARKVAVARMGEMPDETFAGRQELAQFTGQMEAEQIREQYKLRADELRKHVADEIQATQDAVKAGKISQEAGVADIKKLQTDYQLWLVLQGKEGADAIELHRLEANAKTNQLILEQHKQLQQEMLQDTLDTISQNRSLRTAYAGATPADNLQQRLAQINEIEQAELKAIDDTRDARVAAAKEALDYYKQMHPTGAGIPEEEQKFQREQARQFQQAMTDQQLVRINAWKEGDQAIIEQQKSMYESLQSGFETVLDAIFDRSKSVWESIGNALKNAILNAFKTILSSRLAAALMPVFGAGTVSFTGQRTGILGLPAPVFSGAGAAPAIVLPSPAQTGITYQDVVNPSEGGADRMMDDYVGALQAQVQAAQSPVGSADRLIADAKTSGLSYDYGYSPVGFNPETAGLPGPSAPYSPIPVGWSIPNVARPPSPPQMSMQKLMEAFNIGKPIVAAGRTIPWAQATAAQKLAAIARSPGASTLALTMGSAMFMGGLQGRATLGGNIQTIAGGALAGFGAVPLLSSLGLIATPGLGIAAGAGLGIMAAGIQRGRGALGITMGIGGGLLAGAAIGAMLMPLVGPLGPLVGAAIGAAVGGIGAAIHQPATTKMRNMIRQAYGVDISSIQILQQLVDLANQKYGGDFRVTVYSSEVMDMVRQYALASGQSMAGLPRPMYPATFAQSAAGGLQLQPVYSGGQLVQNPYTGRTTQQIQNALQYTPSSIFLQLNPQQASDLFTGRVVQAVQANPGVVAQTNASAVRSGMSRQAQAGALLEPSTVLA